MSDDNNHVLEDARHRARLPLTGAIALHQIGVLFRKGLKVVLRERPATRPVQRQVRDQALQLAGRPWGGL